MMIWPRSSFRALIMTVVRTDYEATVPGRRDAAPWPLRRALGPSGPWAATSGHAGSDKSLGLTHRKVFGDDPQVGCGARLFVRQSQ